jgi:plasmid maintenance system antidote protein VapI
MRTITIQRARDTKPKRAQKKKHVLARLRAIIGGSQKNAANYLGIATDTCASIESDRAHLTPAVARRVASWTGVSAECLLTGKAKLITADGKPFTNEVFLRRQARGNNDPLAWMSPVSFNIYRYV